MADLPSTGLPPTPAAPSWPPTPPKVPRPPSRWAGVAAVAIASVALLVAVAGWFRPVPSAQTPEPVFTEQQIEAAKTRACTAFELVKRGLIVQTKEEPTADAAKIDARAANARLAIVSGARYLELHVDPATPPKIGTAVQELSTVMMDLAENYMAGAQDSDPEQESRLAQAELLVTNVSELCNE